MLPNEVSIYASSIRARQRTTSPNMTSDWHSTTARWLHLPTSVVGNVTDISRMYSTGMRDTRNSLWRKTNSEAANLKETALCMLGLSRKRG